MVLQKLRSFALRLEDPEHPLLGPTIKGFHLFGLWQTGSRFWKTISNLAHFCTVLFCCGMIVDSYIVRQDLYKVLDSMSTNIVFITTVIKCVSYITYQKDWKALAFEISREELNQLNKRDPKVTKQMDQYKSYTRVLTYMYWMLVFSTNMLLLLVPFLKYGSSNTYRENIRSGEEPLPQILSSWYPFDNTKMPGYLWAVCCQVILGCFGCGCLAVYDMNAVAIMSYLRGQMVILKGKCRNIFEGTMSRESIVDNIKECHRHHSVVVNHYKMFNALLSPIMFFYVLVASVTICCSVIQFNLSETTKSQKFWVIQYSMALVFQLFLFCWHGNGVAAETIVVDRGVYESNWWKGDKDIRQLLLLLASKLDAPLMLKAGPFTTLSVSTFISIMKGSGSFYTLFSEMQIDK